MQSGRSGELAVQTERRSIPRRSGKTERCTAGGKAERRIVQVEPKFPAVRKQSVINRTAEDAARKIAFPDFRRGIRRRNMFLPERPRDVDLRVFKFYRRNQHRTVSGQRKRDLHAIRAAEKTP